MRFAGSIYKDGKFWLAELPILGRHDGPQGRTRKEAFAMVATDLTGNPGGSPRDFTVHVHPGEDDHFEK